MKTDISDCTGSNNGANQNVAASIGIEEEDLEFYGKYKANYPQNCGIR